MPDWHSCPPLPLCAVHLSALLLMLTVTLPASPSPPMQWAPRKVLLMGLCGAVDTLASQASGAGQPLGIIFQRAVLFLAVHWCVRLWPPAAARAAAQLLLASTPVAVSCTTPSCCAAPSSRRPAWPPCLPYHNVATYLPGFPAPWLPQHPHHRTVCGSTLPAGGGGAAGRHDSQRASLPAGAAAELVARCGGTVRGWRQGLGANCFLSQPATCTAAMRALALTLLQPGHALQATYVFPGTISQPSTTPCPAPQLAVNALSPLHHAPCCAGR